MRSNQKKKTQYIAGILIIAGVIFASITFYGYQIFYTPNIRVKGKDSFLLKIPRQARYQEVLDSLVLNRVLTDKLSFSFVAKLMKYQDHIKPGAYELKPNLSNREAIRLLRSGKQTPVNVTFSNARLKRDLAEKLTKNLEIKSETLIEALNDEDIAARYGLDTTTILCIFIPNTYQFFWDISAEGVLDRFNWEFNRFWDEDRVTKAESLGLTPIEVSILASIVEAETQKKVERPVVAGVYLNRLKKKMPLQADPTLVYAHGDFEMKRVLNIHKEIDSPYNTYKRYGLPPGPINIPSANSIDAVLNRAEHKYLYFCAKEDLSGHHAFATNLMDHNKNAQRYQTALNKSKIYK